MTRHQARHGGAAANAVLALAVLCVILALAYPWFAQARFQSRVDAAVSDVDVVQAAAARHHDLEGTWPPDGTAGQAPVELAPFLPAELSMTRPRYRLRWDHWETVTAPEPVEAPPPPPSLDDPVPPAPIPAPEPRFQAVVGVTVYTHDLPLLAALQEHYGASRSFVRDSSLTVIFGGR